jgi:tetratricopeptide (TPR) repeat protein
MVPMFGRRLSRDETIGELEAILRTCPVFYPALFHLGVLQARAGRSDPARRLLLEGADRMAEREPSLAEDIDVTGGVIEPLEDSLCYDLAGELLQRLTEHYPSEPSFHDVLGGVLVVLGEPDGAIRRFEKAVALEPDNARYVCNLGWGLLAAGRLDDAQAHLERSLKMDPDDGITRGNYGVLRFLRRQGGAFEDYLLRPLGRKELERLDPRRGLRRPALVLRLPLRARPARRARPRGLSLRGPGRETKRPGEDRALRRDPPRRLDSGGGEGAHPRGAFRRRSPLALDLTGATTPSWGRGCGLCILTQDDGRIPGMSVLTLEGLVENGRIRLVDGTVLPDKTKVYVVVPDAALQPSHLWSPRLADPEQAAEFRMQVTALPQGDPDAQL